MGLQIEDGRGSGNLMKIDSEGRGFILSISEPIDFHINEVNGKVWSIPFEDLNPTAANDFVVYVKNTGDKNLLLNDIRISSTAATQIVLHKVTGTPAGGSAITPVARNLGSAEVPSATIESGVDITGIITAGTLFYIQCPVIATTYHLSTSANIIITKGTAIALSVENGSANITGVISIYESE